VRPAFGVGLGAGLAAAEAITDRTCNVHLGSMLVVRKFQMTTELAAADRFHSNLKPSRRLSDEMFTPLLHPKNQQRKGLSQ
jgi:hypothetical protein